MLKKITIAQTNINVPEIVTDTPYARYLYHGVKMVNAKTGKGPGVIPGVGPRWRKGTTLVPTAEPLNFNRKLPTAGPYWDRRMVAAEGKQIAEELQGYINQKGEHT